MRYFTRTRRLIAGVRRLILVIRARLFHYKKQRHYYERLIFPSPVEAKLARLLGAIVITLPIKRWWRGPDLAFNARFIIPFGYYKRAGLQREVPVRGYRIDFADPRRRRGIEVDSRWHDDVVADYDRDQNLAKSGWYVIRVHARQLVKGHREYNPKRVRRLVQQWLA